MLKTLSPVNLLLVLLLIKSNKLTRYSTRVEEEYEQKSLLLGSGASYKTESESKKLEVER